ncbi:Trypsin-like serine protease 8, partial [Sarcoptes scabiei]
KGYFFQFFSKAKCGNRIALNVTKFNQISDNYVVGGVESRPNSWPWMVALFRRNRFICGGSILNQRFILTAAHCVYRYGGGTNSTMPPEQLTVHAGTHQLDHLTKAEEIFEENVYNQSSLEKSDDTSPFLSNVIVVRNESNVQETSSAVSSNVNQTTESSKSIVFEVEKVFVHESFNSFTLMNDIALLKLRTKIEFQADRNLNETEKKINSGENSRLQSICLPNKEIDLKEFNGSTSVIIGWGHQREGGRVTNRLHEVRIPIISNEACQKVYGEKRIQMEQICAAEKEGGKDSCQGDSGGPMLVLDGEESAVDSKKFYQLGIVSWGRGCARPGAPGVYTRVSKYVQWILERIESNR